MDSSRFDPDAATVETVVVADAVAAGAVAFAVATHC